MPKTAIGRWRACGYVRLSHEDGDKEESNSVKGQRDLIRDYLSRSPELQECGMKVDDGFTGSNFNRPGFLEMMDDVKAGKVNCIVVKDLSRFGRDHLEVGEYIRKIFPFLGVRFIAINDHYDSMRPNPESDDLIVPFKNLMKNICYLEMQSTKISEIRQGDIFHLDILYVLPLMYPISPNTAFFYQCQQYLRTNLRRGTVSAYNFDKLIPQPAQISVYVGHIPPQTGKVFQQQKVNFTSSHRAGNLAQTSAGEIHSAGTFNGNPHDLKALLFAICFHVCLLSRQRNGVRVCNSTINPGSIMLHSAVLLPNPVTFSTDQTNKLIKHLNILSALTINNSALTDFNMVNQFVNDGPLQRI